jgi:hypothetical protein
VASGITASNFNENQSKLYILKDVSYSLDITGNVNIKNLTQA